jgi:uncharacterized protein (DUF3084 family)
MVNVKDAMLTGAITGGLSQSGAELTNKIFGAGDSVKGAQNVENYCHTIKNAAPTIPKNIHELYH